MERTGASLAADDEGEIGELALAGEGVATLRRVVHGAGYLAPVGGNDGVVEKHESGASVGNAGDGGAGFAVDRVAVRGEHPEALAAVDGGVHNIALELGAVNDLQDIVSIDIGDG